MMEMNLDAAKRNAVLLCMAEEVLAGKDRIIEANRKDLESFHRNDRALFDRLKVDGNKVDDMACALRQLAQQEDPVGKARYHFIHENGLEIVNKTAPFGTVLIIYESRPDVTIEAGGIAFKSGNRILLKGGKEALHSNLAIVDLWHKALEAQGVGRSWVEYLNFDREATREYLRRPDQGIDLIIPRGGEQLITFVKEHATCPVVVSGRGNNFAYVHRGADQAMAREIICNAKTDKISACNALDKVLVDKRLPDLDSFLTALTAELTDSGVEVWVGEGTGPVAGTRTAKEEAMWYQEFLDYRILIGLVDSEKEAIERINKYSGGHSASIVTDDEAVAQRFMEAVDSAAVYHNASTRFTDGFQFGLGGELAISTDKLHQRGPMGLQHLVTNKWYIHGKGQTR